MTKEQAIDYLLDPIGKREMHDEAVAMAVEALRCSEVTKRKKGKWLSNLNEFNDIITVKCSCCGAEDTIQADIFFDATPVFIFNNFCPICGADMRGEEE